MSVDIKMENVRRCFRLSPNDAATIEQDVADVLCGLTKGSNAGKVPTKGQRGRGFKSGEAIPKESSRHRVAKVIAGSSENLKGICKIALRDGLGPMSDNQARGAAMGLAEEGLAEKAQISGVLYFQLTSKGKAELSITEYEQGTRNMPDYIKEGSLQHSLLESLFGQKRLSARKIYKDWKYPLNQREKGEIKEALANMIDAALVMKTGERNETKYTITRLGEEMLRGAQKAA